jgi:hypothetical protein
MSAAQLRFFYLPIGGYVDRWRDRHDSAHLWSKPARFPFRMEKHPKRVVDTLSGGTYILDIVVTVAAVDADEIIRDRRHSYRVAIVIFLAEDAALLEGFFDRLAVGKWPSHVNGIEAGSHPLPISILGGNRSCKKREDREAGSNKVRENSNHVRFLFMKKEGRGRMSAARGTILPRR